MRAWLLDLLVCPACGGDLRWTEFTRDGDHLMDGTLQCARCAVWYPVAHGVPRMLPPPLRSEVTAEFTSTFAASLRTAPNGEPSPTARPDALTTVKSQTLTNFGFEWTAYARHGWDDPDYNLETEEAVFRHKSLMDPAEFTGRVVLDAGCGNGRYTYWAARYGARVVGVDLTRAVDAAFANTRDIDDTAIVQGDLFALPFRRECFDLAFSIGVLMHTGDARSALLSIAGHVRSGGSLTAHVYGMGNPVYEWVDSAIRRRTTRMSIPRLRLLADRLYRVARWTDRLRVRPLLTCFVRLDEHPHCIFDWYAAPVASHHTYEEVERWFVGAGYRLERTNRSFASAVFVKRALMRALRYPWPVTVRGRREAAR